MPVPCSVPCAGRACPPPWLCLSPALSPCASRACPSCQLCLSPALSPAPSPVPAVPVPCPIPRASCACPPPCPRAGRARPGVPRRVAGPVPRRSQPPARDRIKRGHVVASPARSRDRHRGGAGPRWSAERPRDGGGAPAARVPGGGSAGAGRRVPVRGRGGAACCATGAVPGTPRVLPGFPGAGDGVSDSAAPAAPRPRYHR